MDQFHKKYDITISNHLSRSPYTQTKQKTLAFLNSKQGISTDRRTFSNINIDNEFKNTHRSNFSNINKNQLSPIRNLNRNAQHNNIQKQYQTLKIRLAFIEAQNLQLKKQNQFLSQQTKKINQNYLIFLDEEEKSQQEKSSMIEIIKIKHHEELVNLQKRFIQSQSKLKQTIKNFEKVFDSLKKQNFSLIEKIPIYEKSIHQKNHEIQDLKNHISIIKVQIDQLQHNFSTKQTHFKKQLQHVLQKNQSLQIKSQINQKQLYLLKQTKKQMQKQIQILLKIQQQKSNQSLNLKQTIQSLSKQISTLKQINDEQIIKYQKLMVKLRQDQNSINQYKLLVNALKQQNNCLIRQIDSKKQRQMNMIESQKVNREKYSITLEKKNKQISDLINQNERLYKQINKIKFQIKKQNF